MSRRETMEAKDTVWNTKREEDGMFSKDEIFELGKQAGIREVVEWVEKEREEARKLIGVTLNKETDYRARGKASFIIALLKYISSRNGG